MGMAIRPACSGVSGFGSGFSEAVDENRLGMCPGPTVGCQRTTLWRAVEANSSLVTAISYMLKL